jgi:hypothetical protein
MTDSDKKPLSLPTLPHPSTSGRFVSRQGPRLALAIMVVLVAGLLATTVYGPVSVAAPAHVPPTSLGHGRSLEVISNARRARFVVSGDSITIRWPTQRDSFIVLSGRVMTVSGKALNCGRLERATPVKVTVDVGSALVPAAQPVTADSAISMVWQGLALLRLFDRTLRSRIACLTGIAR